MNAFLEANPKLNEALVRLKQSDDFGVFRSALDDFRRRAVSDGLGGTGELGIRARGVALCYGDILSMIDDAAPPANRGGET